MPLKSARRAVAVLNLFRFKRYCKMLLSVMVLMLSLPTLAGFGRLRGECFAFGMPFLAPRGRKKSNYQSWLLHTSQSGYDCPNLCKNLTQLTEWTVAEEDYMPGREAFIPDSDEGGCVRDRSGGMCHTADKLCPFPLNASRG